jgi:hypothetical protein
LGKRKHAKDSESDDGGDSSDGDDSIDKSIDDNILLPEGSHFVDIPWKKPPTTKGGAKRDGVMDQLTVKCYISSDPSQAPIHRCVANCGFYLTTRTKSRWLKHATLGCNKIVTYNPDLKALATTEAMKSSPSERLAAVQEAESDTHDTKRRKTNGGIESFVEDGQKLGLKRRKAQLDFDTTILWATQSLPPTLLDKTAWKNVITTSSGGKLMTPTREQMMYELIPAEALTVQAKQNSILSKSTNLTLSYDGGTSRGREAFFLYHVSITGGETYMVYGREATEESHTGEWIKDNAVQQVR